jgi:hypothetical protein|tara:strand:- start:128 stop:538 length:411 start_codon:yes stop_codon:yes gene_type:complete
MAMKKKSFGQYKNGLEKYCGDSLRQFKYDFKYEEQFILVEGFEYPSDHYKSVPKNKCLVNVTGRKTLPIKYRPDFYLPKEKVIIETKGFVRANDSFPLRWKLFLRHLMDAGMSDHAVFIPKNKSQVDEVLTYLKSR